MPNINALQVPNCDIPGNAATLYLYAQRPFVANGGEWIVAGKFPELNWRYKFDCTIANRILSIPAKSVKATTNSDDPTVKYEAVLVDQLGYPQKFFIKKFKVPHDLGNNITWEQIRIFNSGSPENLPDEYYTVAQTDQLFATLINNPAFIAALVGSEDFITALAGSLALIAAITSSEAFNETLLQMVSDLPNNEVFLNALLDNDDFMDAVTARVLSSTLVTPPTDLELTDNDGSLGIDFGESQALLGLDYYEITITRGA